MQQQADEAKNQANSSPRLQMSAGNKIVPYT